MEFQKKNLMITAFDGKKAAQNRAGLGNYSRFVIRSMAERYPECQFDVYVGRIKDESLLKPLEQYPNVTICRPTHPVLKHFPKLWERFGIAYELRKRGADIFHGLGNTLPHGIKKVKGLKTIVTIHDLIFLCFPHTYSWIDRHLYNLKFKSACTHADRIVAVSQCTANDIVKYYFIPKQKISIAYQGCDPIFRKECSQSTISAAREKYSLPKKFILTVGTIEERKNAVQIVRALQGIPEEELVIAGRKTPYADLVSQTAEELHIADRVHILDNVSTQDLAAIYRMADVFVYPSKYEGFGIPILEALCSGTPVVGATGSCLEEAGGNAALYADPDDALDLEKKIQQVLSDGGLRERMAAKGLQYASGFSDEVLADRLMEIYKDVLSR